ncbi:hypothetical protein IWX47DRAFT_872218 [Phyllosticta citricarpa]
MGSTWTQPLSWSRGFLHYRGGLGREGVLSFGLLLGLDLLIGMMNGFNNVFGDVKGGGFGGFIGMDWVDGVTLKKAWGLGLFRAVDLVVDRGGVSWDWVLRMGF